MTASTSVADYAFAVLSDAELQSLHDEMRASSEWMLKERHRRATSVQGCEEPCVLQGHRVDDGRLSSLVEAHPDIGGNPM